MGKQRNQCFKVGLFVISLFLLGACSSTSEMEDESANTESAATVSYTHLTLPTIYSV